MYIMYMYMYLNTVESYKYWGQIFMDKLTF